MGVFLYDRGTPADGVYPNSWPEHSRAHYLRRARSESGRHRIQPREEPPPHDYIHVHDLCSARGEPVLRKQQALENTEGHYKKKASHRQCASPHRRTFACTERIQRAEPHDRLIEIGFTDDTKTVCSKAGALLRRLAAAHGAGGARAC